jgi:hypothetical protein
MHQSGRASPEANRHASLACPADRVNERSDHGDTMIGLSELLAARGFSPDRRKIKLVRHADPRFDLEELVRRGWFERYQQSQGKPIFDRCEQIVGFIGEEGTRSRFVGVYEIGNRLPFAKAPIGAEPIPDWMADAKYWYEAHRRLGFEDLENRLVVDWGSGTRSWHQWYSDKEVVEIRAKGRLLPPFQDYLKVNLSFGELEELVRLAAAHRDWVAALRAVGGVYLIVSRDGRQYVGSATGENGLWQRWAEYAKTKHCGNAKLVQLCETDQSYPSGFTFSILETFSRTTARDIALQQEAFFKRKLGSRAFGLNDN